MDYASSSRKTATDSGGGLGQCHEDVLEEQFAAIVGRFSVAEARQRRLLCLT
jgi:hypothetical protein